MKAYVIERDGGPAVLQLRDIPSVLPQADEVGARVRAFGFIETDRAIGKLVVTV